MKKDDVISHLQIMHTWASFAHERGELLGLPEICSIEEWTADTIELLKEQDEIIQRVLREKTNELNYKTTTMQIEIQNKEIRKVLEQKK